MGHNFSVRFPLREGCRVPFSPLFERHWKLKGEGNVRFDYHFKGEGYVRQSNKSLIVFPVLEIDDAVPGKSYEVRNKLWEKAVNLARELQLEFPGLLLSPPVGWRPSTQEYAVEDDYAKSLDKTVENDFGKIDKSVHVGEDGHVYSGGEIDWKAPEFADAYIRMPITFMKAMKVFEENMSSHVKAIKQIGDNAQKLGQATERLEKNLRPKKKRVFRESLKKSATVRATT